MFRIIFLVSNLYSTWGLNPSSTQVWILLSTWGRIFNLSGFESLINLEFDSLINRRLNPNQPGFQSLINLGLNIKSTRVHILKQPGHESKIQKTYSHPYSLGIKSLMQMGFECLIDLGSNPYSILFGSVKVAPLRSFLFYDVY
jgi:hypothetical protein